MEYYKYTDIDMMIDGLSSDAFKYYKYPVADDMILLPIKSPGIIVCNHANKEAKLLSRNINLSSVTPNLAEWNYILYSWIEEDLKTNDCYQISKEEAFIEVL